MLDRWNEKPPWLAETKERLQYLSQKKLNLEPFNT
jgi:hypothetical protein